MKQRAEYNTMFDQNVAFEFGLLCQFLPFFNELLSIQNVHVARFARNVKCDFFCDFQTLWAFKKLGFSETFGKSTYAFLVTDFQRRHKVAHRHKELSTKCIP